MALEHLEHITEEDLAQYGVVAAPDILKGRPADNKKIFDRLVASMVAPKVNAMIDIENQLVDAEDIRTEQEAGRVVAETGRVEAEKERVAAENLRLSAETERGEAEVKRIEAERTRQSREMVREKAEMLRGRSEREREAAEQARADETAGIVARAAEQADKAGASAEQAVQVAVRTPYVGENGNWMVWDRGAAKFVDSGVKAQGPKGDQGVIVDLETGVFGMEVSPEGHLLVMVNDGQTPPPMEINDAGHLIYQIKRET